MYPDLPPHLQTLNALPTSDSPPSTAWNEEQEEGLWSFLQTDDIFGPSFTSQPSSEEIIDKPIEPSTQAQTLDPILSSVPATAPAPAQKQPGSTGQGITAPTLESFLATFASSALAAPSLPNSYLLPLPMPFGSSSTIDTTNNGNGNGNTQTQDVMNYTNGSAWGGSEYDVGEEGSLSGVKRLKKAGAAMADIEEDKRRRNTEASARFRLKKKEREQALDKRAKDLESQVSNLTSEKQALLSENKLLKYLLLKTGNSGPEASEGLQEILEGLGKRKRE